MEMLEKFDIAAADIKYEKPPVVVPEVGSAKDVPFYFHIATDTDLSVVVPSAASVFVTFVVGVAALMFQRRQVRANITNFRHQWMVELRSCAAEYLQSLYSMAWGLVAKEDYSKSPEYTVFCDKIAILTFKIELLLSRDDPSTSKIFELDKSLCKKLYALTYEDSMDDFLQDLLELRDLFRIELEDAWLDVQVDLSAKKRKVRKNEIFARLSAVIRRPVVKKPEVTGVQQEARVTEPTKL